MVKKMKWINLMDARTLEIKPDVFDDLLNQCDSLFSEKLTATGEVQYDESMLHDSYHYVYDSFFDDDTTNNIWKDMDIFLSSFKEKDKRIFNEIRLRLFQYLGFFKKVLTDDGVARKMVTHRNYSGTGTSSGDYKNYYSETPQIELTNFDDAIKYASTLEKNEDSRDTSKEGESDFELKSFNWDEALKNMKMVFYNDLIRYINSLPLLVYDYYALDEYPVGYSIAEYFKTMKDLYARR